MTCIVAVEAEGKVVMGADSFAKTHTDYLWTRYAEGKLFRLGNILLGLSGSVRSKQVIERLPVAGDVEEEGAGEYLVQQFAPAVWKALKESEQLCKLDDANGVMGVDATMLAAVGGRLFFVDSALAVCRPLCGYYAIGQGTEPALGSLHTTQKINEGGEAIGFTPADRVTLALRAAEAHCSGVRSRADGRFDIETT